MLYRLSKQKILRDYNCFLENFLTPPTLELDYFHPIQFPVVISEAKVKLRSVQDYSVLSLLILRLFDAGIRDPEAIRSISGMSLRTVKTYIEREQFMLEHIDPHTGELTEMGRDTLKANDNLLGEKAESVQFYQSVLRVHIDPLTVSLIPQYLESEDKLAQNIQPNEEAGDFLLTRESAPTEPDFWDDLNERLTEDINKRKDKHVQLDILKNGNLIEHIEGFTPKPIHIFYRWGYLVKFKGMHYPMIVYAGKKTATNSNAASIAAGKRQGDVVVPIAIAESDMAYLIRHDMYLPDVLTRSDSCFEELRFLTQEMPLTMPDFSSDDDFPEQDVGAEENVEVEEAEDVLEYISEGSAKSENTEEAACEIDGGNGEDGDHL